MELVGAALIQCGEFHIGDRRDDCAGLQGSRAESDHALNQRDAAIIDYTRALELHPDEAFLFRGREYRIMKACPQAAADFEQATTLRPQWAEAHNQAAGIYSDCAIQTRLSHSSSTRLPSRRTSGT
jgi:tetratricopeptide (TPR) repeat protein